jgi:hypothetical protein
LDAAGRGGNVARLVRQSVPILLLTILVAALAGPADALARGKLIADLQLTSHEPATPTGGTLHLVWPDGPGGKPKPEAKGVFELPAGSRINENAIPTCFASDPELQVEGDAACPVGSGIGPGAITLLTGLGSPVDPVFLDDQWFHGPGQIFALITPRGLPRPITVNRVKIEGASFVASPSLPPGYPPSTKTVPKQSDQTIDQRVSAAGSFLTTPPICPDNGKWIAHGTVIYDDGSVDRATSVTPCNQPSR